MKWNLYGLTRLDNPCFMVIAAARDVDHVFTVFENVCAQWLGWTPPAASGEVTILMDHGITVELF